MHQARFPCAGPTDKSHHLPGCYRETDTLQYPSFVTGVRKANVFQRDVALRAVDSMLPWVSLGRRVDLGKQILRGGKPR